jgi:Methane oxygenase PmoA
MRRHLVWLLTLALLGHVAAANGQGDKVRIKLNKGAFDFYIGDELVTSYHTAGFSKPIFWPVNAPGGVPLTRNYPPPEGQAKDHPHQKSAWFCHGDVISEGIELTSKIKGVAGVDYWSEAKGHGKIVFVSNSAVKGENGHASFVTKNEWHTAEGTKIMDEMRTIHLFTERGRFEVPKPRLIVVEIDLYASVCPITFNDTKEGAFGIRINDVINAGKKGKGKIQNADGKIGEKECWGQKSAWCDYSGPIDGKVVGLAIFDDPKNPYPACWHVRSYGLMAANPFGREKHAEFPAMKGNNELVRLKKGEHLKLRYGMLLHTGDAVSGDVAAAYKRFVELRAKE